MHSTMLSVEDLNIGLVGWNGKINFGDDAMTSVIIAYFEKKYPSAEFHIYGDQDNLPNYKTQSRKIGLPFLKHVNRIKIVRNVVQRYLYIPRFAKKLDILIIGGGSIFQNSKVIDRNTRLIKSARRHNPQVVVGSIGVSVGPFNSRKAEIIFLQMLEQIDFISVRDRQSFARLESTGSAIPRSLSFDLAVLFSDLNGVTTTSEVAEDSGVVLGVSLRQNKIDLTNLTYVADSLVSTVKSGHFDKIRIFSFCGERGSGDEDISRKLESILLESHVPVERVNYSNDPYEFFQEFRTCSVMVAMRLHAAIMAYSTGIPVLVLSYHDKCRDFADYISLPESAIFANDNIEPSLLVSMLIASIDQSNQSNDIMAVSKAKKLARKHFELYEQHGNVNTDVLD